VVESDAWIASFENAIQIRDADQIHLLLQTLPIIQNIDAMKQILLLTMDAEVMLCEIRQELVNQREIIISQRL